MNEDGYLDSYWEDQYEPFGYAADGYDWDCEPDEWVWGED